MFCSMQKTTYKVKGIPKRIDGTHWEVELTDLNSNGSFRIKAQLTQSNGELISGLVIEGPETYLNKILTLRILAGFSSNDDGSSLVDGGFEIDPHIKTIGELEEEDRLIDIASPFKSD